MWKRSASSASAAAVGKNSTGVPSSPQRVTVTSWPRRCEKPRGLELRHAAGGVRASREHSKGRGILRDRRRGDKARPSALRDGRHSTAATGALSRSGANEVREARRLRASPAARAGPRARRPRAARRARARGRCAGFPARDHRRCARGRCRAAPQGRREPARLEGETSGAPGAPRAPLVRHGDELAEGEARHRDAVWTGVVGERARARCSSQRRRSLRSALAERAQERDLLRRRGSRSRAAPPRAPPAPGLGALAGPGRRPGTRAPCAQPRAPCCALCCAVRTARPYGTGAEARSSSEHGLARELRSSHAARARPARASDATPGRASASRVVPARARTPLRRDRSTIERGARHDQQEVRRSPDREGRGAADRRLVRMEGNARHRDQCPVRSVRLVHAHHVLVPARAVAHAAGLVARASRSARGCAPGRRSSRGRRRTHAAQRRIGASWSVGCARGRRLVPGVVAVALVAVRARAARLGREDDARAKFETAKLFGYAPEPKPTHVVGRRRWRGPAPRWILCSMVRKLIVTPGVVAGALAATYCGRSSDAGRAVAQDAGLEAAPPEAVEGELLVAVEAARAAGDELVGLDRRRPSRPGSRRSSRPRSSW